MQSMASIPLEDMSHFALGEMYFVCRGRKRVNRKDTVPTRTSHNCRILGSEGQEPECESCSLIV